jgi:hypothetical protein
VITDRRRPRWLLRRPGGDTMDMMRRLDRQLRGSDADGIPAPLP